MAFVNRKILFAYTISPNNNLPETDQTNLCLYGCQNLAPPSAPKHEMSTILIIMLCLLGATFLLLSYLTIIKYRRNSSTRHSPPFDDIHNFRLDHGEHQETVVDHHVWHIRTVGLPQPVIDSIAVFKYKKGEQLIEGSDCSVCLNEFEEDECLRLLPKCNHSFHVNCIDTWLRSHQNCPVCRAPIVSASTTSCTTDPATVTEENQVDNELEEGVSGINGSSAREIVTGIGSSVLDTEEKKGCRILSNESIMDKINAGVLRVLSDLTDRQGKMDYGELRRERRSVSLDFCSAPVVYVKKVKGRYISNTGILENQKVDAIGKRANRNNASLYRLMKCSSYGSSLQTVPVLMKRSFSLSGKHSIKTYSRTRDSIVAA